MAITNIFINGYGAPKDPINDENLSVYLSAVLRFIKEHKNDKFSMYLFGGITDNPELSEADAMNSWFKSRRMPPNIDNFIIINHTMTAKDNIISFSEMVNAHVQTIFFCEYSRRFHMRFLIGRFFKNFEIYGIKFDKRSLSPMHQLKQIFLRFPLTILAWCIPFIDRLVQKPLRARHIKRRRKKSGN